MLVIPEQERGYAYGIMRRLHGEYFLTRCFLRENHTIHLITCDTTKLLHCLLFIEAFSCEVTMSVAFTAI